MRRSGSSWKRKRRHKPSFRFDLQKRALRGAFLLRKADTGSAGRWPATSMMSRHATAAGQRPALPGLCHTRYAARSFPCNAVAAQYAHAARPWEGTGPAFPPWARPTSHGRGCHAQSTDAAVLPAAVRAVRRFRAVALRRDDGAGQCPANRWYVGVSAACRGVQAPAAVHPNAAWRTAPTAPAAPCRCASATVPVHSDRRAGPCPVPAPGPGVRRRPTSGTRR